MFYAFYNWYDGPSFRTHTSPRFETKQEMWSHVQTIKQHAESNPNVRLNNLFVWELSAGGSSKEMVWCMNPEQLATDQRMLRNIASRKSQRVRDI